MEKPTLFMLQPVRRGSGELLSAANVGHGQEHLIAGFLNKIETFLDRLAGCHP